VTTAYYAAPQAPEDAKRLFEAACASMGLADGANPVPLPLRAARGYPSALVLAREWGLKDLEQRLVDAIEASYEHLSLAPLVEDPTQWTTFRIVGVEPRLWYLTGIEGATMDVRPDSVVVRVPMVAGDLEFTPGSY